MTIKAIFFDAAGTLIKPARRVGESYASIARTYRIDVTPSEISERFRICFDSAPPLAFPGAAASDLQRLERNWWRQLVERIFDPWGRFEDFDDFFAELFAYFAQPQSWSLYPEVLETLSALERRGLILGVISNFDSRLVQILHGLGAAEYFGTISISSRVGHAKPAREIFAAALKQHDVAAENALHVGDSGANDVRGAIDAGLKGILIDRDGDNESDLLLRVSNLTEILAYLDDCENLSGDPPAAHSRRPKT
jgi:putative hydrolase of the HAD superfamily